MSTHNIGFNGKLTKIIFQLSSDNIKYIPTLHVLLTIAGRNVNTIKYLNIRTQDNFVINTIKFKGSFTML